MTPPSSATHPLITVASDVTKRFPEATPLTSGNAAATCAGAVLAGGLSTRMGRPKAWLPFGGEPLLRRVVDRLRECFAEVVVVAAADQELPETNAPIVYDRRPARGPLGAIETALGSVAAPAVFAVSCDTPFLQAALTRRVADLAREWDVVVPRWEGRLHPLCAAYRTSLRTAVSRLLDAERLRPVFLLEETRSRILDEEEIRTLDPAGLSFVNANTPEEYAAAVAAAPPRIVFELFGQPRILTGRREVAVDVPPPATVRSALDALARAAPALVGPVLGLDGELGPGFLLSLGGREFTREAGRQVADGDRLLLLASSAGG